LLASSRTQPVRHSLLRLLQPATAAADGHQLPRCTGGRCGGRCRSRKLKIRH
jgi:hypothetical protein